jgi:peptidoglycan/LPS O-acetylase OafA/YrhL
MYSRLDRAYRALPLALGVITLIGIVLLLAWDADGKLFSIQMHAALEAFTLAGIAVAYLLYQSALRPQPAEWMKTIMLVAAFLFWAANQVWPDPKQALVLNDVAIALFVLDVFLVMAGWPKASQDESLAEAHTQAESHRTPLGK